MMLEEERERMYKNTYYVGWLVIIEPTIVDPPLT